MLRFDPPRDDAAILAALHASAFPDPWSAQAILDLLATPGTFAFHLPDGFVLGRAVGDEAEILTLAVTPAARRHGHGRALLLAAGAEAQSRGAATLFLEVATDNAAALALYRAVGFAGAGTRKSYYRRPGDSKAGDAWILRAPLPLRTDFP